MIRRSFYPIFYGNRDRVKGICDNFVQNLYTGHKNNPSCNTAGGTVFLAICLLKTANLFLISAHAAHIRCAMAVSCFFFWFIGNNTFCC